MWRWRHKKTFSVSNLHTFYYGVYYSYYWSPASRSCYNFKNEVNWYKRELSCVRILQWIGSLVYCVFTVDLRGGCSLQFPLWAPGSLCLSAAVVVNNTVSDGNDNLYCTLYCIFIYCTYNILYSHILYIIFLFLHVSVFSCTLCLNYELLLGNYLKLLKLISS